MIPKSAKEDRNVVSLNTSYPSATCLIFFLLEHFAHTAQKVCRRDAKSEFEDTVVCCSIPSR